MILFFPSVDPSSPLFPTKTKFVFDDQRPPGVGGWGLEEGGRGKRSVGAHKLTLLKGVFFFFSFFIQNLGLVCVDRHTGSCMGSNLRCWRAWSLGGEDGDYGSRGVRISDSIWTWESKFEEDS